MADRYFNLGSGPEAVDRLINEGAAEEYMQGGTRMLAMRDVIVGTREGNSVQANVSKVARVCLAAFLTVLYRFQKNDLQNLLR